MKSVADFLKSIICCLILALAREATANTIDAKQEIINRIQAKYPGFADVRNLKFKTSGPFKLDPVSIDPTTTTASILKISVPNCTPGTLKKSDTYKQAYKKTHSIKITNSVQTGQNLNFGIDVDGIKMDYGYKTTVTSETDVADGEEYDASADENINVDVPPWRLTWAISRINISHGTQAFHGVVTVSGEFVLYPSRVVAGGVIYPYRSLESVMSRQDLTFLVSGVINGVLVTQIQIAYIQEPQKLTLQSPECSLNFAPETSTFVLHQGRQR